MAQKILNGVHISGTTQIDFMPTHESEGIITLGRYDANTSRYHNIKSYVSSTEASNYLKFSLHNGTANTVVDVLTLNGNKTATFAGDIIATHAGTPMVKLIDTTNDLQARFRVANSYAYLSVDNPNNVGSSRLVFQVDGAEALHLNASQKATFAGSIESNSITIDSHAPGNAVLTLQYDSNQDSPATVDNNDILGAIHFKGIDDSASNAVTGVYGKILATSDGLWDGSGNRGIDLSFHTGKYSGGSVSTAAALTLDQDQNATFAGTIGATNFSGSSSGTNTGDQDLSSFLTSSSTQSKYLRSDISDSGTGTLTLGDTSAADNPLILGSSSQTSYTLQQFQTSQHGTNEAYLIAYGAGHGTQAGNFAMKNMQGEIFFELASGSIPLRMSTASSTFGGNIIGSGNLFLRSYNNSGKGIFFRDGFEYGDSNPYNLSITILNDGDSSSDGLEINAYDGIYFNTGSGTQNIRAKIAGSGDAIFYNNVGVGNTPVDFSFLERSLHITAGSGSSTTLQQSGLIISGSSDADDADDFGYISFTNYQSTLSNDRVAEIRAYKAGSNVDTGKIKFYTANGTTLTEAVEINEAQGTNFYGAVSVPSNDLSIGSYAGTATARLVLYGTTANNGASIIKTTNGNLHIDSDDDHGIYLNYYNGTNTGAAVTIGNGNTGSSGTYFNATGDVVIGRDLTVSRDAIISGEAPRLRLKDTRNLNNGEWDNVSLGNIEFYTSDTTTPGARALAEIEAFSNAAAASGPNAELRFKTSENTSTSPQTRLTIKHDGTAQFTHQVVFDKTNATGGGDFNFIEMGYNGSWSNNQGGLAAISVDDGTGVVGKYGISYGAGGGRFVITDLYNGGYGASGDVFEIRGDGNAYFSGHTYFATDITVNGGDFNLTKQNGSPIVNMLHDGNNPATDTLLQHLNFKVDYSGTDQDWGGIEHRTTTSATRTKLNFNVKSTGGSVLNALSLDGTTDGTKAIFGGSITMNNTGNIFSDSIFQFLNTGSGAQYGKFRGIQLSTSYSGTIPSQGILFGTDTNLYRDGADVLKTDDSLYIGNSLHIGPGNSRYIFNSDTVTVAGSGTSNAGAIEWKQGTHYIPSLAYAFKVRLVTTGTGTDTGANYIVYYNNTTSAWVIRHVSLAGNVSNHPLLTMVSDGNGTYIGAYDNHSGTYHIRYFVESWDTGDQDMDGHAFGSDFHWQRLNDTLTYPDGDVVVTNDISANNLSGTNTGDQDLSGYVTLNTQQTISGVKSFSNQNNHYNGHFYYDSYDTNGNHYPHFLDGSGNTGTTINWRQYYGSSLKTHTWASDSSGNMIFTYQGAIKAVGELEGNSLDINGAADISGNLDVGGNVVITGNLTVDGTTTTLNTQTVEVEDNIIVLNKTQSDSSATATTSGISVYRGNGVTEASFIFDDGDDTWNLTDSLEVVSNISLGYAIKHVGDTGTDITFSTGQILLQTSTNGNYLNIHNNGINYYNASSHNFTGAITCNNKVTADLGFTSHNQRGISTNPSTTEEYPLGHYTGGKEIWSLDTTWSNSQLQEYFNSTNVEWYEDSTAPAGYSIKISGGVNTGGYYGSGFPYIPIEEGSIYLIEVYIRNESGSSIGHYMGTQDFEHDFTATASGSGNPGSYGYHLMANHNPGTDWQHRYAFVSGHHNNDVGKFETGAKYFTPHSLFNYSHNSGTRRCYISGWRVTRIAEQEFFAQGTAAKPAIVLDDGVYNSVPNSGLYREWYDGAAATKDQISVSIDGTRRLRVNEAGVWTDQNFYVGGDWRTFSSTWDASAGTSGAGFRFHNTHTDTNGVVALTISATGDGIFGGTMTAKGATINSPTGSGQDTIINLTGTNTSNFGSTYAIKSQIKSIAIGNTNAYASKLIFSTNDTSNNLNPALQIDENKNVEVYGNIRHQGTTMTEGTDVDQYKYFPMTFQLSANTWTDTGIDGTDLATGVYAMQVYVSDFNVGGGHYYEYYSGMLSWYADSTNSTHVDEIPIHRAGHAPNSGDVQFRTQRASGSDTHDLMLQVKHNLAYTGALDNSDGGKIMRFKFRRLI